MRLPLKTLLGVGFVCLALTATVLAAQSGTDQTADEPPCDRVRLLGGWAQATVAGMPNSAIYGVLANLTEAEDRLISASSPAAEFVELHEMTMAAGDIMQMRPLSDGIGVLGGDYALLQPGGLHIMLINLVAPLAVGDTLELTLTFERAGDIVVSVPVRDPQAEAMSEGHGGVGQED